MQRTPRAQNEEVWPPFHLLIFQTLPEKNATSPAGHGHGQGDDDGDGDGDGEAHMPGLAIAHTDDHSTLIEDDLQSLMSTL